MQGLGMALSLPDKLKVAECLDDMGFDYIEGGYPLSNPKDQEFFKEVSKMRLKHSKVSAFGMTHRKGMKPEDDEGMASLLRSGAPVVCIVGKTWDLHVEAVLQCTLEQNLEMIGDTIAFFKGKVEEVFYDAEHFFDGYAANPEYAIKTLQAAYNAGATRLVLCDTNGGALPQGVNQAVAAVLAALGPDVKLGIHVHNDGGLAVANTLAAVSSGVHQVQGTINGIGERCGNVDLVSVIPNLKLKMGFECLNDSALEQMTNISRTLYDLTNTTPVANQPYVGHAAFAHKGGMHVHAVAKIPHTYEHINPEIVGNARQVLVSELSGHSNVEALIGKKFQGISKATRAAVVQRVADLENRGYQFEAAQASFELLVHEMMMQKKPRYWDLDYYRCAITRTVKPSKATVTHAILKLRVGQNYEHNIADGDGPVHAMDSVMRKTLMNYYPVLKHIHLADYKVRVVNPDMSTGAKVRVLADFNSTVNGTVHHITTVGVHENIFVASCKVIEDAFNWHLLESGVEEPLEETFTKELSPPKWASIGEEIY